MFRLGAQADRVFARPHEITQGFIIGRRNVDRRELTGAMQPGQGVAIPPVGLDPVAAPRRHARGIDDDAILPLAGEKAVDAEAARARFVHDTPSSIRCAQRSDDLGHCLQVAGNHPVAAYLAVSPLLGERDVDRFLVDIHPHEHATFRHGLPSVVCGSARHPHRRRVIHDVLREAGLCSDSHTV